MITYTLEELYQFRASPLSAAPIPDSLQQLLQPGRVGRWNNVRRHEPLGKGGGVGGGTKLHSPHNDAKSPPGPIPQVPLAAEASDPLSVSEESIKNDITTTATIITEPPPPPPPPPSSSSAGVGGLLSTSEIGMAPLLTISQPSLEDPPPPPLPMMNKEDVGPPPGWAGVNNPGQALPMWCQPQAHHQYGGGVGDSDQLGFDDWDSPLPSSGLPGDIENFTLGDIRAAETAVESMGVPLQVYIDRVKKQGQVGSCLDTSCGGIGLGNPPSACRPSNVPLAGDPLGQTSAAAFGPKIGLSHPQNNAAGELPALHSLLGRGPQDIFFNEHVQCGESKFMSFFAERSRRAEESRLNGNATPFYPSKYSPPGFDDPRKYAPFLPQATRSGAGVGRGFNYDDSGVPSAKQPPNPSQKGGQTQRDIQALLMRLARQQGTGPHHPSGPVVHPGQQQPYYDQPPPTQQQQAYIQQQNLDSAMKVTPQQLLQLIHVVSKDNSQPFTGRQKDFIRFAMTRLSQLQAQQQAAGGIQQPPPNANVVPGVYHPPPPPPPQQMMNNNCRPEMVVRPEMTHPMVGLAQQQQQMMLNTGSGGGAVGAPYQPGFESYRDPRSSEITAIAEALQKTLQNQKAKGITPTAGQRQTLIQVLNALQKLKAQKNAANAAAAASQGCQPPTHDLYGGVSAAYSAPSNPVRKNTDNCGGVPPSLPAEQQVRKENNIGIDE